MELTETTLQAPDSALVSDEAPWVVEACRVDPFPAKDLASSGRLVRLRDTGSGAALSLGSHTFQGRTGRVLRFCVPVDHLIDFAGAKQPPCPPWRDSVKFSRHDELAAQLLRPGWDGSVEFSCHGERTAIVLSLRVWRLGGTRDPQITKPWWQRWSRFIP